MALWMLIVFVASTDLGAESHTSRILVPLLHWLDPGMSAATIEHVHLIVRKAGHVTEYAILALLILRGLRILRGDSPHGWSWSNALWALCGAASYAVTDEVHQLFVPSRGPSVHDVMIDACGAILGLLLAYWWTRPEALQTAKA